MGKYDDIINLPHWEPKTHQRMSALDRAGQFAPFAALTGYDSMVAEKARITDSMKELDEDQRLNLDNVLASIMDRIGEHPRVSITWFKKDMKKVGGKYVHTEGEVRDVELPNRCIVLRTGERISLDDIREISI